VIFHFDMELILPYMSVYSLCPIIITKSLTVGFFFTTFKPSKYVVLYYYF
jgi:hypothetical protein